MTAGTIKDYIGSGLLSARPASPAITAVTGGSARYFATDNSTEYAWNGSAWVAVSSGGTAAVTQISKITLGSSGVFSFTSIPGTYNELQLVIYGRLSVAGNAIGLWRVNSDSGANYEYQWAAVQAAFAQLFSASATGFVANWTVGTGQGASHVGTARVYIPQYANTSFYKGFTAESQYADGSGGLLLTASGEWRNTAAITRLDSVDSFLTGSVAILYGVS